MALRRRALVRATGLRHLPYGLGGRDRGNRGKSAESALNQCIGCISSGIAWEPRGSKTLGSFAVCQAVDMHLKQFGKIIVVSK
ncbi:MAG: hypothetical protein KDA64_02520 [Rhodospirillaceae bacterium]|nr:hypothetical protein [Rhodospirillaceae bacterium]